MIPEIETTVPPNGNPGYRASSPASWKSRFVRFSTRPLRRIIGRVLAGELWTTPTSLAGQLEEVFGFELADLAMYPEVGLAEDLGVWLSGPVASPTFGRIAVVELYGGKDRFHSMAGAMEHLVALLGVADLRGIPVQTVVTPVLGAGDLHIDPARTIVELVPRIKRGLERIRGLQRVLFVERSPERAEALDEALNGMLGRSRGELTTVTSGTAVEAIRTELVAVLNGLRLGVEGGSFGSARNTIDELITVLVRPATRFAELAFLGRRFAESMVSDLVGKGQGEIVLASRIEKLREVGVARWIESYLHVLRVFGNVAAHAGEPGMAAGADIGDRDVLVLIMCLLRVAEFWAGRSKERR